MNTFEPGVVADPGGGTADSRRANDRPALAEPAAVERYIADLLRRAHRTAEAIHGPDEARAILHVAQLFAEDLAKSDPQFDRLQFIEAITRQPT